MKQLLVQPRFLAGMIVMAFGLVLAVDYNPEDYRAKSAYSGRTVSESANIMSENTEKEQKRDFHVIGIVVMLALGTLMMVNGWWRWSQKHLADIPPFPDEALHLMRPGDEADDALEDCD